MPKTFLVAGLLLMTSLLPLRADPPAGTPDPDTLTLEPAAGNNKPAPEAATPAPSELPVPLVLLPVPHDDDEPNTPPTVASPVLRTVKAYYVGYAEDSFEAVSRYIAALDIVAGQWLAVDANGQLKESPDTTRNDEVRRIVHAAGKKVYTCVVNKDFSVATLSRILSTPERRSAAIDHILAFIAKKGDDGIDLDFEGINRGHRDGYTAFVKELAEKLHARGKELSIALDVTWEGAPSPGLDYETLAQYADSLMPMTYTFGPGRTAHSPVSYLEKAASLGTRSMDPRKFMIGIGVYGRDYNLSSGRKTNPNARKLQAIIAQHSPDVVYDKTTLTKRAYYEDESGHGHALYFDDPETIRAKLTRLATKYQVSAVGFWRLGQEDPLMWDFIHLASGRKHPDQTAKR